MDAEFLHQLIADEPQLRTSGIRWEMVDRGNGDALIVPSEPRPFLYRGQTSRHRPCFPTISRGLAVGVNTLQELSAPDRFKIIANLARAWWFCDILESHPAFVWAKSQHIHVDSMALAQHYGIPTGYIDLTESLEVAAFFATCSYRDGAWHPVTAGTGVLYRIMWQRLEQSFDRVKPIGLQPFPRPTEQWGWTIAMNLGEDFEALPDLQKIEFSQQRHVSEFFWEKFHRGEDLFPSDPVAEVAARILKYPGLPAAFLHAVAADVTADPSGAELRDADLDGGVERNLGLPLLPETPAIVRDAERAEINNIWSSKKDSFFKSVGFRLIRQSKEPPSNSA